MLNAIRYNELLPTKVFMQVYVKHRLAFADDALANVWAFICVGFVVYQANVPVTKAATAGEAIDW